MSSEKGNRRSVPFMALWGVVMFENDGRRSVDNGQRSQNTSEALRVWNFKKQIEGLMLRPIVDKAAACGTSVPLRTPSSSSGCPISDPIPC